MLRLAATAAQGCHVSPPGAASGHGHSPSSHSSPGMPRQPARGRFRAWALPQQPQQPKSSSAPGPGCGPRLGSHHSRLRQLHDSAREHLSMNA
jgi:hypothetical protein